MSGKKVKYILMAVFAVLMVWFIKDAFTQPGVQDLEGGFTEVALYRNENNTGPIQRIYAVTVSDSSLWDQMQAYGDYMPHTKYGTTKVYFFLEGQAPEAVTPGEQNFDAQFQQYCLAKYEKDAMGQVSLVKRPFR